MSALINGVLGLISCVVLGVQYLDLSIQDIATCMFSSWISGLIAMSVTLRSERTPWIKKKIMTRQSKTWVIFMTLYFGSLVLFAPPLRDWRVFWILVIPLILVTGFSILFFGPIQDHFVKKQQRKTRLIR